MIVREGSFIGVHADLGPDARIWFRDDEREPIFAIAWDQTEISLSPEHGTVAARDVEQAEKLVNAAQSYLAACRERVSA